MQVFNDSKKIIELTLLWEITKALNVSMNPQDLINSLNQIFQVFLQIDQIKIWIYDENTETIRDFSKNWCIVDKKAEKDNLSNIFTTLSLAHGQGFLINKSLIQFDNSEQDLLKNSDELLNSEKTLITLPVTDKNNVIGIVEIICPQINKKIYTRDFIMCLNIAAIQISTAIVNMKLREQMQLSINFHQAMKDIAKIIESQYELNYIIPLIGEMMDKFIPDHLIYIFNKNEENNFNLLWPGSYCPERINPYLEEITPNSDYITSPDMHIGIFPLIVEGEVTGAIVADGKYNKLTDGETNYLQQLSRQAAITIDKANCYAEILKHATIDALTGLSNRRQFEDRLVQETSIAKRKKTPLCCMMVDVDYFKSINDTYGHSVGDQILHDLARIIREEIRTYDSAARYGGEEFCILLPDTPIAKAEMIAERLRSKVETTNFDISSANLKNVKNISITLSVGISEFNPKSSNPKKLYEDADVALYKAKQSGRNRVILFNH